MSGPAVELELLYEPDGLPGETLHGELGRRYPGTLGFERPCVVANFVSSIDGVVAIPGLQQSSRLIADASDADRFVMALLRAHADAILVGSGTLQASPTSRWMPESAYPPLAGALRELRAGRPDTPTLAVVTGSGDVDPAHPAFARGALVLTTDAGAERLGNRITPPSEVVTCGAGATVDLSRALEFLRSRDHRLVLVEAGPHVFGSLLVEDLVDELFVTVSPLLAGRDGTERPGFVEGRELLPDVHLGGRLLGVRRAGAHLFLRYGLDRPDAGHEPTS